ncbi:MAG: hypothetical protein ACHQ9S_26720 [Candidatus Binatia bacterium]
MRYTFDGLRFAAGNSPVRAFCLSLIVVAAALTVSVPQVEAGCGCDKPPPLPGEVRPKVAYAGAPVSFFSPSFAVGQQYNVTFANSITGDTASVGGKVASLRDLADGVFKPQLVVPLPRLPLGPTTIVVTSPGAVSSEVLFIGDSDFTVAPDPVVVPSQTGAYSFQNFQVVVSRNGVSYISLDLTNVAQPLIVEAQALGYPLRFRTQDVVFYNIQGFLMQLLTQGSGSTQPVPGMWVIPASSTDATSKSDLLHYSRHEFETYFLQHAERQPHAVDPTDPNWHMDGTRHVDHNHLILAIMGQLNSGAIPPAGASPMFTLGIRTYSLFGQGLVGINSIATSGSVQTDSYSPTTLTTGSSGDVLTNGKLSMSGGIINGRATANSIKLSGSATITGTQTTVSTPTTFMQIKLPTLLTNLGGINLNGKTQTVTGPGSFLLSSLAVNSGAKLYIDNSAGPVTFYVTGGVSVTGGGIVQVADPNPEKFAIYVTGTSQVSLTGGSSTFYGVVYAPNSTLVISGSGDFAGSFVSNQIQLSNLARVHYDQALKGQ